MIVFTCYLEMNNDQDYMNSLSRHDDKNKELKQRLKTETIMKP